VVTSYSVQSPAVSLFKAICDKILVNLILKHVKRIVKERQGKTRKEIQFECMLKMAVPAVTLHGFTFLSLTHF
jgi:hypothetical protein